jgi:hypothetical protein
MNDDFEAAIRRVPERHFAAAAGRDAANDCQAEAAAAIGGACRFELGEGFERAIAIAAGDPRSVVANAQDGARRRSTSSATSTGGAPCCSALSIRLSSRRCRLPARSLPGMVAAASLDGDFDSGRPSSRWRRPRRCSSVARTIGGGLLGAVPRCAGRRGTGRRCAPCRRHRAPGRPARTLAFEQGEAQAQTRQRRAQVVRQAGEHLAPLGGRAGQLVEHGVVALGETAHLARTLRRRPCAPLPSPVAIDRFAKARQRPDDAAHEEAGDQHHGASVAARHSHRSTGSACGSKRGGGSTSHQRSLTGHEADPQAATRPRRRSCRSSTGSPSWSSEALGKRRAKRKRGDARGTRRAIGPQLEPCSPASAARSRRRRASASSPGRTVCSNRTWPAINCTVWLHVRYAENTEEREGGQFGDGDDGDDQQDGARRRATRERSAASLGEPSRLSPFSPSGTKT